MNMIAFLQTPSGAASLVQFLPIIAIGLIFYFLVIAPANKQRKKTQEMLSSLKKGDRVITASGIYGTIHDVQGEVVYLRVADNVKLKMSRTAIAGPDVSQGDDSAVTPGRKV